MTIEKPRTGRIAIIGAGFSGSLVAAHLSRIALRGTEIALIEKAPRQQGRGVAYGTELACHLLNVPAGNMSAFPDDPDHFLRWARARRDSLLCPPWVTEVEAGSFLPRRAYGRYLVDLLDAAVREAAPGIELSHHTAEVIRMAETPDGVCLQLRDGPRLLADRAVLALGNFPPGDPCVAEPAFYASMRYHGNPWKPGLLDTVLATRSCLLIGGGLTMVDWAIALKSAGYTGLIHAISRRGLWPRAHAPAMATAFALDTVAPSTRNWLRALRRHIRETGGDWRAAIDALRPANQTLWQSLPLAEQRRFLRHLRPWWDCHRHRLAPIVAARLQALVDDGQLVCHVGRILEYREQPDTVEILVRPRHGGDAGVIAVDAVLNCSGSESDYRRLESPLVSDLLDRGLIRPDTLRLGLDVAADGALRRDDGTPSDRLFTLGPPEKGMLWETTAVPEIRIKAARLAERLSRP